MIPLNSNPNVDNVDLVNYPDGRIKDNSGVGDGTGVNRNVYGDLHSTISKLMRLYAITPNGLADNETTGFQIIEALRGLASKNDFIYPLSTNGIVLNVDIKFSQMLTNEFIVCLAQFNKGSETQINGLGAGTFAITYSGNFKTNEYVRVIKTSGGISIIRLADALSLDAMVGDFLYLKKASQVEENTGAIETVATTPLVNKVTYALRTIGVDSVNYLATALRNGLYPKEHFAIVAGLGLSPVKNKGYIEVLDIFGTVGDITCVGDFTKATVSNGLSGHSNILVKMANTMANTFYKVNINIQSLGNINNDSDISVMVFKVGSVTEFNLHIGQTSSSVQALRVHLEVVQL